MLTVSPTGNGATNLLAGEAKATCIRDVKALQDQI